MAIYSAAENFPGVELIDTMAGIHRRSQRYRSLCLG